MSSKLLCALLDDLNDFWTTGLRVRYVAKDMGHVQTELLDEDRALEPPESIPNSAVKRRFADGSVGSPHVRVGHRQAPNRTPAGNPAGVFFVGC